MDQLNLPKGWRPEDLLHKDYAELLPKGWKREEKLRRSGLSGHPYHVYYYSPQRQKFSNKRDMQAYFGKLIDLSFFNYRTGRLNLLSLRRVDKRTRIMKQLNMPTRQQPAPTVSSKVSIVKDQPSSKVNEELKNGTHQLPRQLFWEKRLETLSSGAEFKLPASLKQVGPNVNENTAIRSLSAALYRNNIRVIGQNDARIHEKNAAVFVNPDQPLVEALVISDEHLRVQQEKLRQARENLKNHIHNYS